METPRMGCASCAEVHGVEPCSRVCPCYTGDAPFQSDILWRCPNQVTAGAWTAEDKIGWYGPVVMLVLPYNTNTDTHFDLFDFCALAALMAYAKANC